MYRLTLRLSALFILLYFSSAAAFSAEALKKQKYLQPEECNFTLFVSSPPANDSMRTKSEINEILDFQSNRTKEMTEGAVLDQYISVFRFADVIGPEFNSENLPVTDIFFSNVVENAKAVINVYKARWHRPRPYTLDGRVEPCVEKPANDSYPSGHSTIGNLIATILAAMIPEKNYTIFGRGWKFGINRIIGGVHYRSDVEAGRICAAVMAEELFRNPEFMHDFEQSRSEVRRVLKLEESVPAVSYSR